MTDWRGLVAERVPGLPADVADELAQHLADVYDEALRHDLGHDDAHRLTVATLTECEASFKADIDAAARTLRDVLARRWREPVLPPPDHGRKDVASLARSAGYLIREGWRGLWVTPATTIFVLAILTTGIAAATVTFSVVDAVVIRPLPFDDPARLAAVEARSTRGTTDTRVPVYLFEQLRDRARSFSSLGAAVRNVNVMLESGDEPHEVSGALATASLFDTLGVQPILGTVFSEANEAAGNDDVAVIGHDLWQGRFGGDPSIVGHRLPVADDDDRPVIVGVMPAGFSFPLIDEVRPEVWRPFVADDRQRSGERLTQTFYVVGRLAAAVTTASVDAEVDGLRSSLLASDGPEDLAALRVSTRPLADVVHGEVRGWMLLLLGAVGLVMLVACANVANLLLTRSARRARELAIRASMGASRRRLIMAMLVESLLLSLIAAGAGVMLAFWGVDAARTVVPADIARASQIALDLRVLLVVVAAAFATGLSFGVVPAWHASRADIGALLKDGSSSATSGRTPLRSAFLVAEIALVALLLVASTLFITSFVRVLGADLGFDRRNLLVVASSGSGVEVEDVLRALNETPGVVAAAAVNLAPPPLAIAGGFEYRPTGTPVWRAGGPTGPSTLSPLLAQVGPDYFDTLGLRILSGRALTSDDFGRTDRVVLDELTTSALFGAENPVGRTVMHGQGDGEAAQVVGLVQNVLERGPEVSPSPQIYMPMRFPWNGLIVRTAGDATLAVPVVASLLDRLSSSGRPARVQPLDDAFGTITAGRRFAAGLMAAFGVLALAIGAAGIYGVMSSIVAQRSREIGIRLALGATSRAIAGGVLGSAGRHMVAGLGIGLMIAAAAARGFASIFYGVTPADASVYAIVGVLCLAAGLVATAVPARRASRVDPLTSLRSE